MKKISSKVVYWLGVIIIGVLVGLSLQFVKAWTEPPAGTTPPEGNVEAPINVSGNTQEKAGTLMLNTAGAYQYGLIVNGYVGVGTASPAYKMQIRGGTWDNSWHSLLSLANLYGDGAVFSMKTAENVFDSQAFKISQRLIGSASLQDTLLINNFGNVGIGTASPKDKGAGGGKGFIDVEDAYIRDAGKWASELGGSGTSIEIPSPGCFTFGPNSAPGTAFVASTCPDGYYAKGINQTFIGPDIDDESVRVTCCKFNSSIATYCGGGNTILTPGGSTSDAWGYCEFSSAAPCYSGAECTSGSVAGTRKRTKYVCQSDGTTQTSTESETCYQTFPSCICT